MLPPKKAIFKGSFFCIFLFVQYNPLLKDKHSGNFFLNKRQAPPPAANLTLIRSPFFTVWVETR